MKTRGIFMRFNKTLLLLPVLLAYSLQPAYSITFGDLVEDAKNALGSSQNSPATESTVTNSDGGTVGEQKIAIGFSPEGSAQKAILDLLNSAHKEVRVAAYSFTSPVIARALTNAKRRGVDVKLVVDEKGNKSKLSIAAMNIVVNADIPIRTIGKYAIHHDKYIVVDGSSVETGSFNYSGSANSRNSENVIVLYNMPEVAKQYLLHWDSRWNEGTNWTSTY